MTENIELQLQVRIDEAKAQLKEINTTLKGLGEEVKSTGQGIGNVFKGSFTEMKSAFDLVGNAFNKIKSTFGGFITAANQQALAFSGLASVATAYGQDIQLANKYTKELASDGLITLESSAKSIKLLMASGFSVTEAMDIAKAGKDIGSYNNVIGDLNMAMYDFARGLKTGSIELIENIGFTQRLSGVMKAYNVDISQGIDLSNSAAQRQAVYNAFMAEGNKFQGNAVKLAKENAGVNTQLGNSFLQLSASIGDLLNTAFRPFIDILIPIINGLKDNLPVAVGITIGAFIGLFPVLSLLTTKIAAMGTAITVASGGLNILGAIAGAILGGVVASFISTADSADKTTEAVKKLNVEMDKLDKKELLIKKTQLEAELVTFNQKRDELFANQKAALEKQAELEKQYDAIAIKQTNDTYDQLTVAQGAFYVNESGNIDDAISKKDMVIRQSAEERYLLEDMAFNRRQIQGEAEKILDLNRQKETTEAELTAIKLKISEKSQLSAEELADLASYYEAVKFEDSRYFAWKSEQIAIEIGKKQLTDAEMDTMTKVALDKLLADEQAYFDSKRTASTKYTADEINAQAAHFAELKKNYDQSAAAWEATLQAKQLANIEYQENRKQQEFGALSMLHGLGLEDESYHAAVLEQKKRQLDNFFADNLISYQEYLAALQALDNQEADRKDQDNARSAQSMAREGQKYFKAFSNIANSFSQIEMKKIQDHYSFKQKALDNQLKQGKISEEQYQIETQKLKNQAMEAERAQKEKKRFWAIGESIMNTAVAVTQALPNIFLAALIGIQGGIQTAMIAAQQFAFGGLLSGPKHTDGGIPFTIAGRPGFEAEGGEYMIRASKVQEYGVGFFDSINFGNKNGNSLPKFAYADGGSVNSGAYYQDASFMEMFVEKIADAVSRRNVVVELDGKNFVKEIVIPNQSKLANEGYNAD